MRHICQERIWVRENVQENEKCNLSEKLWSFGKLYLSLSVSEVYYLQILENGKRQNGTEVANGSGKPVFQIIAVFKISCRNLAGGDRKGYSFRCRDNLRNVYVKNVSRIKV